MKAKFRVLSLAVLLFPAHVWPQNADNTTTIFGGNAQPVGIEGKFSYSMPGKRAAHL